jgi:hypothetical protein
MQCPKCEFYKVESELRKDKDSILTLFILWPIIWFVGLVIALIIGMVIGAFFGNPDAGECILAIIWTIMCVVGAINSMRDSLATKQESHNRYHCTHCGYTWE